MDTDPQAPEQHEGYNIENRRYIGCKSKLVDWIFELIDRETVNCESFCDIFAGTGTVAGRAISLYPREIVNDFLPSNNVIYKAFWEDLPWNIEKVYSYRSKYNNISPARLKDNYFSQNYGDRYYDKNVAKIIGYIRGDIEKSKKNLSEKEYCILLASLIYSIDKLANTLGHFDAYIKKEIPLRHFEMTMVNTRTFPGVTIHKQDANSLARQVQSDIVYIDPPYNSRQYSRFYHVYDNLIQWKKPKLYGAAFKPVEENMSEYCRSSAFRAFSDLVQHLNAKYLVISYNNTYKSKSTSSANKIRLDQIENVLEMCGPTKVFNHAHNPFNSGKTEFEDHKEYLFITEIDNERRNTSFASVLCR